MDMVHLPGKGVGGRRVPLILSPNVVSAMEVLAQKRESCHIPASNVYFFATPTTNGYINGWQVMQDVSVAAKLEHPQLIHSTRLRKYVATVSQVNIGPVNILKLIIFFSVFTHYNSKFRQISVCAMLNICFPSPKKSLLSSSSVLHSLLQSN
jgi:hypothetical protein